MKPTSQPSFTRRPIHQSLLYFCSILSLSFGCSLLVRLTYLFYVQKVFDTKGNSKSMDRTVVVNRSIVRDIRPDGERDWL